MINNLLSLIQEHTRKIYNLENKKYTIQQVPARDLLSISRFDLFAKLFYIRNRESNPIEAKRVYIEHIKVFNPDLKEPGRDDKCTLNNFLSTFDKMIQDFSSSDFDSSQSVVPVDKNGIILDGAHRVAALSFYNKEITIAQFEDVESNGVFNYRYFLNRGLSIATADTIALEATLWCKNLYAACIWPKIAKNKDRKYIEDFIKSEQTILYAKTMYLSLNKLTRFIAKIYEDQDWVGTEENHFLGAQYKAGNCYGLHKKCEIIIFYSPLPVNEIVKMKEMIRAHFNYGKHSLHVTDNDSQTRYLSELVLNKRYRKLWLEDGNFITINKLHEKMNEISVLFRYNYYLPFKIFVYRLLHL